MAKSENDRKIISWTTLQPGDVFKIRSTCYAIGWGYDKKSNNSFLMSLRQTNIAILNHDFSCVKFATENKISHKRMICAGKDYNMPQYYFVSIIFIELLNINF